MPRDDVIAIGAAAEQFLGSAVTQKARSDLQAAIYRMWLDAETEEAREKLHGVAFGAEMFWRIMEGYSQATQYEDLAEELRQAIL